MYYRPRLLTFFFMNDINHDLYSSMFVLVNIFFLFSKDRKTRLSLFWKTTHRRNWRCAHKSDAFFFAAWPFSLFRFLTMQADECRRRSQRHPADWEVKRTIFRFLFNFSAFKNMLFIVSHFDACYLQVFLLLSFFSCILVSKINK